MIANPVALIVFNVDHPILALLVEELSKLPLFTSRVTDPMAS
jgi:hypothetical protein